MLFLFTAVSFVVERWTAGSEFVCELQRLPTSLTVQLLICSFPSRQPIQCYRKADLRPNQWLALHRNHRDDLSTELRLV